MRSTRKVTFAVGGFDLFELVLGLLLVVDVEFHEALAGGGEGVEVGGMGRRGSSRSRLAATRDVSAGLR